VRRVVALTGAGISAESGLKTFRDSGGLWEGYDVNTVATPEAWHRDMKLVLDFYNMRRSQLKTAQPNQAHRLIADLQEYYHVDVVTQNVDDLHERAGSKNVLHLHGELKKVRSANNEDLVYDWTDDLNLGDLCEDGYQLRPHIVWFGEAVPLLPRAAELIAGCDVLIIVGTSLQVYPAASLVAYASRAEVYYIDPNPNINYELSGMDFHAIEEPATIGMERLLNFLKTMA
jgi:NAD-dependent deacetylase